MLAAETITPSHIVVTLSTRDHPRQRAAPTQSANPSQRKAPSMLTAHSLAELVTLPRPDAPSIVTIGNFDGVHLGHQTVIAEVISRARTQNARSVVVTFHPHPSHVLPAATPTPLITPLPRKLELLAQTGVDLTLVLPFTPALYTLTARQFAQQLLCDALHTTEIHEGETFRFGHQAEGDLAHLAELGRTLCFTVHPFQPVLRRGAPVSSSRIRTLIAAGDMHTTRALLGRPFSLDSTPAPGRGYGTRYAVPTINLATPAPSASFTTSHAVISTGAQSAEWRDPRSTPHSGLSTEAPEPTEGARWKDPRPTPELLPAHGVYITTLRIGTGPTAPVFQGVTNAGNRPTFGPDSYAIETHLLNFHPLPLTETTPLRLTFLHHLREERRFPTPEALKSQILQDVHQARRFFHLCAVRNIPC